MSQGTKCFNILTIYTTIAFKKREEFIRNDKSIFKTQKRFKTEMRNVFTEEIDEIALSLNNDKRMQLIDLIRRYACETNKDLVSEK